MNGDLEGGGTQPGPCEGECRHTDCAETRRQAAAICPECGTEIGYDREFTIYSLDEQPDALWHLECLELRNERSARGRGDLTAAQCAALGVAVLDLEIEETISDLAAAEANGLENYAEELRADLEALRMRRLSLLSPRAGAALCSEM